MKWMKMTLPARLVAIAALIGVDPEKELKSGKIFDSEDKRDEELAIELFWHPDGGADVVVEAVDLLKGLFLHPGQEYLPDDQVRKNITALAYEKGPSKAVVWLDSMSMNREDIFWLIGELLKKASAAEKRYLSWKLFNLSMIAITPDED